MKYIVLLVILSLSILWEYLYQEWVEAFLLLILLFFSYKALWLYFDLIVKYTEKKSEKSKE